MRRWLPLFLLAGCASVVPVKREAFSLGGDGASGRERASGASAEDPRASPALAAALDHLSEGARLLRSAARTGEPLPAAEVALWSEALTAVERLLSVPAARASAFDAVRARLVLETELDSDRQVYGDVPGALAERLQTALRRLTGRLDALAQQQRRVDPRTFLWPVQPVLVTSPYGTRTHPIRGEAQFHAGVDLLAEQAQPIYAAESGLVAFSGWNGGYGKEIELHHDPLTSTRYGHLQTLLVRAGATVKRGQLLGLAGMTGQATGPHLHFELRREGAPLDPEAFLSEVKPMLFSEVLR